MSELAGKIPILYVNPFAQTISGNDEVLLKMITVLDRERFEPHILLPARGPYAEKYERLGAKLHFRSMSIINRRLSPVYLAGFALKFIPSALSINKLAKRIGAKIIHTNTTTILGSGMAAKLAGVKSVYHEHSIAISWPEWVSRPLVKSVDSFSDVIVANSQAVADIFLTKGVPLSKVKVIYNALDPADYEIGSEHGSSFREEFGVKEDDRLVGLVGRINPSKGHDILLKAIKALAKGHPSIKVVFVGQAELEVEKKFHHELKNLADTLGVGERVIFTGMRDDIPRVMKGLDLLVLPSHHEGFGIVLMEGMAAGVPVIGSNVGGIPELIEDGRTGLLVEPGNHKALAEAIDRVLSDSEMALKFACNGKEKVKESFSLERLGKELNSLYSDLLKL